MANDKWIVSDSQCVPSLGLGELLQLESAPSQFHARIVLNSYESNCVRDWLAQRWNSPSLMQTSISCAEGGVLSVNLSFVAKSLSDAVISFEAWLKHVLDDRLRLEQSRK